MPSPQTSLLEKRKYADMIGWCARMTPKIYNPPTYGVCKKIVLDDVTHIGLIIGKNGSVFNAITHQTPGVEYIWYDKDTKSIEVWAETINGIQLAFEKTLAAGKLCQLFEKVRQRFQQHHIQWLWTVNRSHYTWLVHNKNCK